MLERLFQTPREQRVWESWMCFILGVGVVWLGIYVVVRVGDSGVPVLRDF